MWMVVPISLRGAKVGFTFKGVTFMAVPEIPADKLNHITPLEILNPEYSLESGAVEWEKEMNREWEKDWSQI